MQKRITTKELEWLGLYKGDIIEHSHKKDYWKTTNHVRLPNECILKHPKYFEDVKENIEDLFNKSVVDLAKKLKISGDLLLQFSEHYNDRAHTTALENENIKLKELLAIKSFEDYFNKAK